MVFFQDEKKQVLETGAWVYMVSFHDEYIQGKVIMQQLNFFYNLGIKIIEYEKYTGNLRGLCFLRGMGPSICDWYSPIFTGPPQHM